MALIVEQHGVAGPLALDDAAAGGAHRRAEGAGSKCPASGEDAVFDDVDVGVAVAAAAAGGLKAGTAVDDEEGDVQGCTTHRRQPQAGGAGQHLTGAAADIDGDDVEAGAGDAFWAAADRDDLRRSVGALPHQWGMAGHDAVEQRVLTAGPQVTQHQQAVVVAAGLNHQGQLAVVDDGPHGGMARPVNDGATLQWCGRDVDGGVYEQQPGFSAVDPGDADSDDASTDVGVGGPHQQRPERPEAQQGAKHGDEYASSPTARHPPSGARPPGPRQQRAPDGARRRTQHGEASAARWSAQSSDSMGRNARPWASATAW